MKVRGNFSLEGLRGFDLKEKKRSDLFKNTDFSSSYNQIWVK